MLRTVLVWTAILGLAGLGILDLVAHHYRTGVAAILLAIANLLLLTTHV